MQSTVTCTPLHVPISVECADNSGKVNPRVRLDADRVSGAIGYGFRFPFPGSSVEHRVKRYTNH